MNKQRRKELAEAIEKLNQAIQLLEEAQEIVETVADEEQEAYDNMPESLQGTERGEMTLDNVSTMEEVRDNIESYIDEINEQIESLEEL